MSENFQNQKFAATPKTDRKSEPGQNCTQTNVHDFKDKSQQEKILASVASTYLLDQTDGEKNANLVGIMAIIAGMLGVHDIYCGNQRNGILKIIFAAIPIFAPISAIWAIIDIYRIGCGSYKPQRDLPMTAAPWCKKAAFVAALVYFAVLTLILRPLVQFFLIKITG